jgi:hypothetical protein
LKAGTCAERLQCAEHLLALLRAEISMQGFLYCTDEKFFGLGAELNLDNMVE